MQLKLKFNMGDTVYFVDYKTVARGILNRVCVSLFNENLPEDIPVGVKSGKVGGFMAHTGNGLSLLSKPTEDGNKYITTEKYDIIVGLDVPSVRRDATQLYATAEEAQAAFEAAEQFYKARKLAEIEQVRLLLENMEKDNKAEE